ALGELRPSLDFITGSGLRAADPAGIIPNGGSQQPYAQVNFGVAQVLGHDTEHALTIRLDITNLFDSIYLLHDGTSVGKGQPQYGPRRGVMLGLRKAF
ncbi:MAG: hypothetical protein RLY97_1039, partial [Pseudomonadota bacterium]